MTYPACQTLLLDQQPGVLQIILNRPDSRNAMNLTMLEELMTSNSGPSYCAAPVVTSAPAAT